MEVIQLGCAVASNTSTIHTAHVIPHGCALVLCTSAHVAIDVPQHSALPLAGQPSPSAHKFICLDNPPQYHHLSCWSPPLAIKAAAHQHSPKPPRSIPHHQITRTPRPAKHEASSRRSRAGRPPPHRPQQPYLAAAVLLLMISCWMLGGTTSYLSRNIEYWARPLVMPRSVDT